MHVKWAYTYKETKGKSRLKYPTSLLTQRDRERGRERETQRERDIETERERERHRERET